jgi:hypothetical protein
MTLEETIVQQGVANDTAYVGCLVRDLSNQKYASFMGVVSLCMAPYLSLFVNESHRKLEKTDPALASSLSSNVKSIVTRSRHSLKLFEDTRRGIDGQLAYFHDEVLPTHSRHFLGNTWLPLARPLEKDLGLFSYDARLIATSHGATFHMGVDPQELLTKTGPELRAIYEEYGRYFARLGARLDTSGETFVSKLDPRRFNQRPNDTRAVRYYRRVFDGTSNPDLNALLTVFRGMMNFVNSVITAGMNKGDVEYTVFKIRFLTLYQILGSLQALHDERLRDLTPRSVAFMERITGSAEARLITEPAAKPFRNTLMHYNLDSRLYATRVDIGQSLFGLVPIYFPSYEVTAFATVVDRCIAETATAIEEWAGR